MIKHILNISGSTVSIEVDQDTDLLTALREEGQYVKSSCGGHASCTDCLIKVVDGIENLNAPSFEETQMLGNVFHITKERLACQTKIEGPVTIDISKHDADADGEKIREKTRNFKKPNVKIRSKEQVKEVKDERIKQREERKVGQDKWQNHWEKDKDPMEAKRLGGGKRPKTFRTDHLDEENIATEPDKENKD